MSVYRVFITCIEISTVVSTHHTMRAGRSAFEVVNLAIRSHIHSFLTRSTFRNKFVMIKTHITWIGSDSTDNKVFVWLFALLLV